MSYHLVTAFNLTDAEAAAELQSIAMEVYSCLGIEEYSLNEPEVDELLGMRSYSGGDLPLDVLEEVDTVMHAGSFHYKFFFSGDQEEVAKNFLLALQTKFLCEAQLETKVDEDWNAEWKKHYRPIHVPGGLVVLPEWEKIETNSTERVIRIHPGMGFGTGSHETTFLCLKAFLALKSELNQKDTVLDYGSGSGILGLATLLYFPDWRALMVDIDPEAHRNCTQNMALNQINSDRVDLLLLDERPMTQFPIVFANILQNILHEERDYLIERTAESGYLILSGLLKSQLSETLEFYLTNPSIELVNQDTKQDWGCIVLRKKS
jgi:ribosomal protein L11 methyltransferase